MNSVLDIFYHDIIMEAQSGRIDCFFHYNIIFNTVIEGKTITKCQEKKDLIIPTLNIKNKEEFDKLLIEYFEYASNFYEKEDFDLLVSKDKEEYYNQKMLMTLLFSNATFEDFEDPLEFLKRRINFIKNSENTKINLGYREEFLGNIILNIEKDSIHNETPYQFYVCMTSEDGLTFTSPRLKFGIENDTIYIYAIQNDKKESNAYAKKINRLIYKFGDGFDQNQDNYDIFEEGNLKDITPSFLLVLNYFIAYFYNLGYQKFKSSSILPERWNAKRTATKYRLDKGTIDNAYYLKLLKNQEAIQKNLTEKFIRTFLRLAYHYNGIEISSFPMQYDSYLSFKVNNLDNCNNQLLGSITNMVINYNETNRIGR